MSILDKFFEYQTCPYDGLTPSSINFCEAQLCGWIRTPGNAFSCLIFVGLAAYIAWRSRRDFPRSGDDQSGHYLGRLMAISAFLVGVLSFVYHASCKLETELLDLAGMYFFGSLAVVINAKRVWPLTRKRSNIVFISGIVVPVVIVAIFPLAGIPLFATQVGIALYLEWITLKAGVKVDHHYAKALLITLAVSFGIWVLDATKIVCNPENHVLNGHVIWHLGNNACLWFFYAHQRLIWRQGGFKNTVYKSDGTKALENDHAR